MPTKPANVQLLAATDAHFAWMLQQALAPEPHALRLPPQGVDSTEILTLLRAAAADLRSKFSGGCWLIIVDQEVVGLISYKRPPDVSGVTEIGFGVAQSRRGQGYATAAIRAVVQLAGNDPRVRSMTAETTLNNHASQAALEAAGFLQAGLRTDADDGELATWVRAL